MQKAFTRLSKALARYLAYPNDLEVRDGCIQRLNVYIELKAEEVFQVIPSFTSQVEFLINELGKRSSINP